MAAARAPVVRTLRIKRPANDMDPAGPLIQNPSWMIARAPHCYRVWMRICSMHACSWHWCLAVEAPGATPASMLIACLEIYGASAT